MSSPSVIVKDKPIFGYWNIRGFGQPIRYLLKYLEVDYVEATYKCTLESKLTEWDAVKDELGLDFPNLPYWIDSKVKLTESRAIISYLARNYDPSLLPEGNDNIVKAQMVDGVISDLWSLLVKATYYNSKETEENYHRDVPNKLTHLAIFMEKLGGPWVLGPKLSYLDFIFYEVLVHNLVYDSALLDHLPILKDFMAKFEQIPAIEKFMKSPSFISKPCFRPWAKVKI